MNNKDKGKKLEEFVANKLQEVLKETPPIRPTKASSGGSHNTERGDIYCKDFMIECKDHEDQTKNIIFDSKVWEKLYGLIRFGEIKTPFYIKKHYNEIYVMLTFNDLCRILGGK
jgi:hypothetical protein